ncbi:GT2 family glycosyltransferase [Dysgonomonas sp. PH5-45]|uniref:glycosyltransferase n=1 Tax=unclassified Dysgonomonas TaxID=2630389 RepID=UPI0024756A36|nr:MULTISPECIES: glycosyltransferase [unclassified Dysgonomonas]MDH6355012.1 GT2 family glycosyltransferase [Dysgonomonas sp. PH5-45]MDH6387863.1 GT2 family glycosyltransferase [Dysgonomonas sp. PH5-37]
MISVIVSVYKKLDNLDLILQGLDRQSYKDFEVVVAEDNDAPETISFLDNARKRHAFAIKHVSQEDKGFRKTRILNKALLVAEGQYLVFLDGDCIPHRHLLRNYHKYLTPNTVCMGKRCALKKEFSEKIVSRKKLGWTNILYLMLNSLTPESGLYLPAEGERNDNYKLILGCNYALPRQLLLDINGFDEDYDHAGVGEDHDIDWRLRKLGGVRFLNIKHSVIVYHIYHDGHYNQKVTLAMNMLLEHKLKQQQIRCLNGIEKLGSELGSEAEKQAIFRFIEESYNKPEEPVTDSATKEAQECTFAPFDFIIPHHTDFNIQQIKHLNILEQYNRCGLDPYRETIVIDLGELEVCQAENKESYILDYLEQNPHNRQILVMGLGTKSERDAVNETIRKKYPKAVSAINKLSPKDEVYLIAQCKFLITSSSFSSDSMHFAKALSVPCVDMNNSDIEILIEQVEKLISF